MDQENTMERDKESVEVLRECIDLQLQKSSDYQHSASTVLQADYYPRGVTTLFDIIWGKLLRTKSLLEAAEAGADAPNFESIEDSFKDLINYASFAVSYIRGDMEGQVVGRDIFNRPFEYTKGSEPEKEDLPWYDRGRDDDDARETHPFPSRVSESNEDGRSQEHLRTS